MSHRTQTIVYFLFIGTVLTFVHGNLLIEDFILNRDDKMLLKPMKEVGSISQYARAREENKILDLQPVRDLSFLGDIWFQRMTQISIFHVMNLLLWMGILIVAYKILILLNLDGRIIWLLLSLYAIHPSLMTSVAWISARKHLLAHFFILITTFIFILLTKGKRKGFLVSGLLVGSYILSVFSQPIGVLWPLWALAYLWMTKQSDRSKVLVGGILACVVIMVGSLYLNYQYYTGSYLAHSSFAKFVRSDEAYGGSVLALGRYFIQLVFPVKLAVTYYPGSWLGLIGLFSFVPFLALLRKTLGTRLVCVWLLFFLFPLSVVTLRMTHIFVSDTYLLIPSFGLLVVLAMVVDKFWSNHRKKIALCGGVVFILFCFKSFGWINAWRSDQSLWEYSYKSEPTPRTLFVHGFHLLQTGKAQQAFLIASRLKHWNPNEFGLPLLYARSTYLNDALSRSEKISLLKKEAFHSPWPQYYLAALYANQSEFHKAYTLGKELLKKPSNLGDEIELIVAEVTYFCLKARGENCSQLRDSVRGALKNKPWDETVYQKKIQHLTRS